MPLALGNEQRDKIIVDRDRAFAALGLRSLDL
jgi:hypothetical protein